MSTKNAFWSTRRSLRKSDPRLLSGQRFSEILHRGVAWGLRVFIKSAFWKTPRSLWKIDPRLLSGHCFSEILSQGVAWGLRISINGAFWKTLRSFGKNPRLLSGQCFSEFGGSVGIELQDSMLHRFIPPRMKTHMKHLCVPRYGHARSDAKSVAHMSKGTRGQNYRKSNATDMF